jgi:hypothetical protein
MKPIFATDEIKKLMNKLASQNPSDFEAGLREYADATKKVTNSALRFQATEVQNGEEILLPIYDGDIVSDIFQTQMYDWGTNISYPKSSTTTDVSDIKAYRLPNLGGPVTVMLTGGEVSCDTYTIGAEIGWEVKYARQSAVNVLAEAQQALLNSFVSDRNEDGWHCLLAAAYGRGSYVVDTGASAGNVSKNFLKTIRTTMASLGGGNSTSINRYRATDLYMSRAAIDSITEWSNSELNEFSRKDAEDAINDQSQTIQFMGYNIHRIDELGSTGAFTTYVKDTLGTGTIPSSKQEVVIAIDKNKSNVFKNPVRGGGVEVYPDVTKFKQGEVSLWGKLDHNFVIVDGRPCLLAYV